MSDAFLFQCFISETYISR